VKEIIFCILFLLLTTAQAFPCVQAVESTSVNVGINIGGTWGKVFFADLSTKSHKQQEVEIMGALQSFLDERTPLTALVLGEETKLADPDRANFFWSDADGKTVDNPLNATHITARSCEVRNVQWDDVRQTFLLTIGIP
jgi:hypothetical protein